jgi:cytochrome oxidase assembly protein ShyY1
VRIAGSIWRETGLRFGDRASEFEGAWPLRVTHLVPDALALRIDGLVPVEIRLEPGAPGAADAHFPMPQFAPEKHYAYAVQWFLLALALVALYVHYGFRRGEAS